MSEGVEDAVYSLVSEKEDARDKSMSASEWCLMVAFMASGVATPLLIGLLHRQGACGAATMFSIFPNYAVMSFTVLGDWQSRHRGIVRWRSVALTTIVDATSQGANYTGLILAGSSTCESSARVQCHSPTPCQLESHRRCTLASVARWRLRVTF
jgi:hypothetical protein